MREFAMVSSEGEINWLLGSFMVVLLRAVTPSPE